jgi:hypothetical protein
MLSSAKVQPAHIVYLRGPWCHLVGVGVPLEARPGSPLIISSSLRSSPSDPDFGPFALLLAGMCSPEVA